MRARRLIAALGVALMCAPGTFVRTHLPEGMPRAIAMERIAGPSSTNDPAWQVAGVWQYSADHRYFGGFSGLLALENGRLIAFSDRGARFAFPRPDPDTPSPGGSSVVVQPVPESLLDDLWDIESATRDPASGQYWLGYENFHSIVRFSAANVPEGARVIEDDVDWPPNAGAEAMIRLADGRFMVLPEGGEEGLLYPSDPVAGASVSRFAFRRPVESYAATDLAQLPDGRLLLLMRNTVFAMPPFDSLLAIGPPPHAGKAWAPRIALHLDAIIPSDNYEGLATRETEDGRVAVWVISDDNLSIMQRTLLAELVFDPAADSD